MVQHWMKDLDRHGNPEIVDGLGPRRVHARDHLRLAVIIVGDHVPTEAREQADASGVPIPEHPLDGSEGDRKGRRPSGHEPPPCVLVSLPSEEANELLPLLHARPESHGMNKQSLVVASRITRARA